MTDIIIIGAGTAGLTAAIYARRASKSVLVFERMSYGGQIINTPSIENYPAEPNISGFDFATKLYEQAVSLGAEIVFKEVVGIEDGGEEKHVLTKDGKFPCKAVIIATGSESRKLELEGEEKLLGRGISYCATCDGAFFKGRDVAVVGGGNTALEDALYLSDIAGTVYLIHRRDGFRGEDASLKKLKEKDNVEFILNSVVTKLNYDRTLQSVEVSDLQGNKCEIAVSGLFVAVGRTPNNGFFENVINLDKSGYADFGEDCVTNTKGVFVAGDNRKKSVRQLVTAAADGAVAATAAVNYISTL